MENNNLYKHFILLILLVFAGISVKGEGSLYVNDTKIAVFGVNMRVNSVELADGDKSKLILGDNSTLSVVMEEGSESFFRDNNAAGGVESEASSLVSFVDVLGTSDDIQVSSVALTSFSNLRVDTDNEIRVVQGNLEVKNTLDIVKGQIYLDNNDNDNYIFVSNSDVNAIQIASSSIEDYINDRDLEVFIVGELKRTITAGQDYYFPVGSALESAFNNDITNRTSVPVRIKYNSSNPSDNLVFSVKFIPTTIDYINEKGLNPENLTSADYEINEYVVGAGRYKGVSNQGGWLVGAENAEFGGSKNFDISTYVFDNFMLPDPDGVSMPLQDNEFALANISYKTNNWMLEDGILPNKGEEGRLTTNNFAKKTSLNHLGFYTIAKLVEKIEVDEFPNLLSLSSHTTNYIIPYKYKDVPNTFVCFTKVGRKVYEKKNYFDDLDISTLHVGIYYYNFIYEEGGKEELIRGFFEIVE